MDLHGAWLYCRKIGVLYQKKIQFVYQSTQKLALFFIFYLKNVIETLDGYMILNYIPISNLCAYYCLIWEEYARFHKNMANCCQLIISLTLVLA